MTGDDIFSALAKYGSTAEENYLTEAFVFLVNSLLEKDRAVALEFLNRLCVTTDSLILTTDDAISISTQEKIEKGILDIKVSTKDDKKLIYIEVKRDSPVYPEQLKRYRNDLDTSGASLRLLILLTKFPIDLSEHQGMTDKLVRWSDVHNWLESVKNKANPVSSYLIEQFVSFLEVKGMSVQRVGREYISGVPALNNLLNMLEAAIIASGIRFYPGYPRSAGWEFKGFMLEDKQFWCGIYFNNPLVLTFELLDKQKFDEGQAENTGFELKKGKERLWFRLPLEEIDFFSLDKDKQLEEIAKFVKTSYAEAQKMRIP